MSAIELQEFWFDEFHLRVGARVLERAGVAVPIGAKAFDLLTHLVVNAGRVVSKDQLLQSVWHSSHVDESNLAQQVLALRRALGDRSGLVVTIPGRGYQFTGAVRSTASALPAGMSVETITQTVRERSTILIEEPMPVQPRLGSPVRSRSRGSIWWISGGLVVLVAAAAAVFWVRAHRPATQEFRTLVVADFVNTTGDATFDQTLKRAVEIEVGQSPAFGVMGGGETVGLLRSMGQKPDVPLLGEVAREVCVRGGRQTLLSGAISTVGQKYLLTLEATDCNTGKKLAAVKARASSKDDVLGAVDSLADQMRAKLGESATSKAEYQIPLTEATTPSLEAWKAYVMGLTMTNQGKDGAAAFFERAIELDPKFAMAWGALANEHTNLQEPVLAAQEYKKAFDLSANVSMYEKLILRAHYYDQGLNDIPEGIRAYQLWAQTYPHEWPPVVNICNAYTQLGQPNAGLPACRLAQVMQPRKALSYTVLIRALTHAGRFEEARAAARTAAEHGVDNASVHCLLYILAVKEHDLAATVSQTQWAGEHSDSYSIWYFPYLQAMAASMDGRYGEAKKRFQASVDAARQASLTETARDVLLDEARVEYLLGLPAEAKKTLAKVSAADLEWPDAVYLRALLGDPAPAEKYLAAHRDDGHLGTINAYIEIPQIRAAVAMQRGKPLEAIAALEKSRPYELSNIDVPSLRAEAYLKSGQAKLAILEYQKILANPGADQSSPTYSLALLGLARAYAAEGEPSLSHVEYESFLAAWKDADADLPALKAARVEMDRLKR
jgi:DNA-binding winged helix-turn-helix (wHTH) protein/tetratricopeptide (TPR) repeat protein